MAKIFIDCGAHCGESILRAKEQFGLDTQVISFEAVPQLAEQLEKIYMDDESVQICNAAVYIKDGTINFNICPAFTDGSSILDTLNDNHKATKIEVPCFDLSSWIADSFTPEDYIILKSSMVKWLMRWDVKIGGKVCLQYIKKYLIITMGLKDG